MVSLSLFLALILLNFSLLISASGGHDGHGHDGHGHDGHDGHGHDGHYGHGHDGHGHDGHGHEDDDDDDYCRRSTNTVTACEGLVLHLFCPGYSKIKILAANYGRTDKKTCIKDIPPREIRNTKCRSSNSLPVVSSWCDGHETCSVPATNGVFSDPCIGTYKYLTVKYCCRRGRS
ncbi:D-galactoside-specific lectin-like [Danio aesculapii]|uniref:D-galactoside-specific lectin-like n=1 Tax=Danio aesculapii TaxID=1142201 RepID=UPI0024C06025|nr:D-galactoside-specific lectin-like [Danio aesculapii]